MIVKRAESAVRPAEWDLESSEIYVYHNVNVVEIPATEERDAMFEYDVEQYTNKEYNTLKQTEQDTAIDDLMIAILEG